MKSLEYAFKSYIGTQNRENSESYINMNNLFMVVDGIGIGSLAEIAKEATCRIVPDAFFKHLSENRNPADALIHAVEEANNKILEERYKLGEKIAASISLIYFHNNIMYFTHLGDSRIYSFQAGELNQLTKDHTVKGEDPLAEKKYDDPRALNALIHGLGIHEKPVVQIKKYPLDKRCLIIMTTTGLTERISNREIAWMSNKFKRPERILRALIEMDKRKGGNADLTVGVIKCGGLTKMMRKVLVTYTAFFILLAAVMGVYALKYGSKDHKVQDVLMDQPLIQDKNQDVLEKSHEDKIMPETEKVVVVQPILQEAKQDKIGLRSDEASVKPVQVVESKNKKGTVDEMPAGGIGPDLFDSTNDFIMEWKDAWESSAGRTGDMDRYMSFYSDKFESEEFNKKTWRIDKETKNRRKAWINITISNLDISGPTSNDRIEVRFNMRYKSSNFSGYSKKVLYLVKEGGFLRIVEERAY